MYYAEEVINGALCYKTSPSGEWHEMTKRQLTVRILQAEALLRKYDEAIKILNSK